MSDPDTYVIPCAHCEGKGSLKIFGTDQSCPVCGGTGEVEAERYEREAIKREQRMNRKLQQLDEDGK